MYTYIYILYDYLQRKKNWMQLKMLARRFKRNIQCFMNVFYAHNAFLYSFYLSEIIYNEWANQWGEQSDQCKCLLMSRI